MQAMCSDNPITGSVRLMTSTKRFLNTKCFLRSLVTCDACDCASQSQSYFTTGGLPPISSFWSKAPWDSRPEIFFQLNPCGHSPYVTFSLTRRWLCLLWIYLAFLQVFVSYLERVIENSSFCTIYKSSISTGFAKQIIHILHILCYNGSLVTWTFVSLTAAKFKPHIYSLRHSFKNPT
jgi:hypothetical protein